MTFFFGISATEIIAEMSKNKRQRRETTGWRTWSCFLSLNHFQFMQIWSQRQEHFTAGKKNKARTKIKAWVDWLVWAAGFWFFLEACWFEIHYENTPEPFWCSFLNFLGVYFLPYFSTFPPLLLFRGIKLVADRSHLSSLFSSFLQPLLVPSLKTSHLSLKVFGLLEK